MVQPKVIVIGGGLAGLATAAALGSVDYSVTVYEARPFLGGRATSYQLSSANGEDDGETTTIDNCQHVTLRCCTNLADFYRRMNKSSAIRYYREFYWVEPGGRVSTMKRGILPAPLHFAGSFAKLHFLSASDKLAVARALLAVNYDYRNRTDLDDITMIEWLEEKRQTSVAIERFWRQILVSAVSEDLERMAARHGLQVFFLGFLANSTNYEMGVPSVPLADLYSQGVWERYQQVTIKQRAPVQQLHFASGRVAGIAAGGLLDTADAYVLAVPFERLSSLIPGFNIDLAPFGHSPITGIHLWFDRPITNLPHATLLDRTMQWMFNKNGGRHVQLVVSASRSLLETPRNEVIALALRELAEFFPAVAEAKLERAHVVKEVRATFSATPGLESLRPTSRTSIPNLFLAGDWTKSGWPSTMEGAVRSGYLAAEAVTGALGTRQQFLVPDPA